MMGEQILVLTSYKLFIGSLDGSIPAIKLSTYRRRLNSGNEVRLPRIQFNFAFLRQYHSIFFFPNINTLHTNLLLYTLQAILDAGNPRNVSSLKRNMGSEFSCMIKEAKFLGVALGIPCLDGWVPYLATLNFSSKI